MYPDFFVVEVHHDTGHGVTGNIIYASNADLPGAVKAARDAEKLGYEFYEINACAVVYAMDSCHRYTKEEFKSGSKSPVILVLRKRDGVWQEKWFNEEYRKMAEKYMQPDRPLSTADML